MLWTLLVRVLTCTHKHGHVLNCIELHPVFSLNALTFKKKHDRQLCL